MIRANEIHRLIDEGNKPKTKDPLVITPRPIISDAGSASVDLRLGTWFVTLRQARMLCLRADEMHGEQLTKTRYVPFGEEYYLHPRSFVLSVTLEWIRLPREFGAYVTGRSSWGRRGLIIATATGVHPGFTGCLTLELTNVGEIPIAISPGMAICQLFLHRVEGSIQGTMDRTQFSGSRKPALGDVKSDDFARKLRGSASAITGQP